MAENVGTPTPVRTSSSKGSSARTTRHDNRAGDGRGRGRLRRGRRRHPDGRARGIRASDGAIPAGIRLDPGGIPAATPRASRWSGSATAARARSGFRPGGGPAAIAYQERTGIKAPRIIAWEITR